MEILESIEVLAPDAAALGPTGRRSRPGRARKISACFSSTACRVRVSLESPAERDGVALGASPFAEIVVRRQNLPAAVDERSYRLSVAPAEGGPPDIPRDAGQGVVVRHRMGFQRFSPGFSD